MDADRPHETALEPREPEAYSVTSFCEAVGISRAHYYRIDRRGLGPRTMKVGGRRLISRAEVRRWCERMTSESNQANTATG